MANPSFKVTPVVVVKPVPPSPLRPSQGPIVPSGVVTDPHGRVLKPAKGSAAPPFAPNQKSTPPRP